MDPKTLPLGRAVDYPREYDASLLFPIARAQGRQSLGLGDAALPFIGADRWHAYEVSWLDRRGKPVVAALTLQVPADTPNLVESKSLKLYLNAFNATRFDDDAAVRACIARDLSRVAGGEVTVHDGVPPAGADDSGILLDALEIDIGHYGPPDATLLGTTREPVEELLRSELLKSNCPVTGQPDWASVRIAYRGPRIDPAGLLRYLVSFRDHAEFHEQCVERIFVDLVSRCRPQALSVEARYTRRGGLDINPWRATRGAPAPVPGRDPRQ